MAMPSQDALREMPQLCDDPGYGVRLNVAKAMTDAIISKDLSNPALWEIIRTAELPPELRPKSEIPGPKPPDFANRMQDLFELTRESALRLQEEYRRYLYLKVIDGGLLTPSMWIDRAWHLHIASPGGAWDDYCDDVLGCRVEHRTGLSVAQSREAYSHTLDLYRREFGVVPPVEIWPSIAHDRLALSGVRIMLAGVAIFISGEVFAILMAAKKGAGVAPDQIGFASWLGVGFFVLGVSIACLGLFLTRGPSLAKTPTLPGCA